MERRLPLLVLLAVVLLGATPAAGDPGGDNDRVDARIGDARQRLSDVQSQEGVLTTELSALTARTRDAAAAVGAEQARLDVLEAELARQQSERRRLEARLERLVERLHVLRREEAIALGRLEQRLRESYMADEPDVVALLLGATSFTELLDNVELLDRIGRQDDRILTAARAARARTAAATARAREARADAVVAERELAARTAEQRAVRDRLAAARDAAIAAQLAKQEALGAIRGTESGLHAEIEQLEAESAAIAATLRRSDPGFASTGTPSGAGLIWPVSGPVTSGYGLRWGRMHEGIDIAVPEGTPVHAAAAGTVVYAGWLGGYGNLVVVDHGGGLATAYGHNSVLTAGVGQSVAQGDAIALSGNTGHSTGPHVHFEVRINGTAVDPLGYL